MSTIKLIAMTRLANAAARWAAQAAAKDQLAYSVLDRGGDPSVETRGADRARRLARLCSQRYAQLARRYA